MRNKIKLQMVFYVYNIMFAVLTVYFLLFAGTYLNDAFIPDKLRWRNGIILKSPNWDDVISILILIIEAIILMYILFLINKKYLKSFLSSQNYISVAKRTTWIISIIPFLFIIMCLYFLKVQIDSPF
jgi:hypothetical protein